MSNWPACCCRVLERGAPLAFAIALIIRIDAGLHAAFIRRRAVNRRHGNISQAQVNTKLGAVMNDVVHHPGARESCLMVMVVQEGMLARCPANQPMVPDFSWGFHENMP